jgi:hypothetical protein
MNQNEPFFLLNDFRYFVTVMESDRKLTDMLGKPNWFGK